jgi:DNA invertase Pin-like site-specific DNA recombinase
MNTSFRVAVYARFSCDKQRDASIEDQVAACRKHCEQRGYEVVGVYPDYAISGRSDDRPQFLKMIEDAGKDMFDIILVWKMDRFARNMQDQYFYEKVLAGYGVRLESAMENIAGNSIEATVSKGMFAMFAQIRSQQTSVDTMRGMLGKAEKCQYLGDRLYGYGHKGDMITVNPAEAEVVARAHNDYLNDVPPDEIVSWMRWEGVKTTRGKDPNYNWLRSMLRNERYAGVYMWGKKKDALGNFELDEYGEKVPLVRIEGGMPAIVTKETKAACLKKLGYGKRYSTKYRYMLSGKLRCSECGELMHGETCRSRNGSIYRHYNCKKKRRACTGSYIVEQVDYAVAKYVRQVLLDRELCSE